MLTPHEKEWIMNCLTDMPFVQWDRYTFNDGVNKRHERFFWLKIYGWIEREDAYKDFVVLDFYKQGNIMEAHHIITSSAKYSQPINEIMMEKDHFDCNRVEDAFNIPNAVKRKAAPTTKVI